MKKIYNLLAIKWLVTLIGILALSILIWFVGPLVAIAGKVPLEAQSVRFFLILLLVLLWGLNNLRINAREKKKNDTLVSEITQENKQIEQASNDEVQLLRQRFDDAMNVLKKSSHSGKGKQYIYDLPWYVFIGPPGSGKTTLLVNSGLRFPLAEQYGHQAIKGVGGTRNCDWWFTDEAVLIDTAGRYTTQDSHSINDSNAWTGFLKLLQKHRKRRPINGIIVSLSLHDILLQSQEEKDAHISAIRNRLFEIQQQLSIQFPVYLIITKTDLVSGFSEFFDDLDKEERDQVWGMTFFNDEKSDSGVMLSSLAQFSEEFEQLITNIKKRVLLRLNYERDLQRRGQIIEFPNQLAAIKSQIHDFIEQVFYSSRFHELPNLRGVYLTSGLQEGSPIDRMMVKLIDAFEFEQQDLPKSDIKGKSFFIKDVLQKVIFSESDLVGVNRQFENKIIWFQRISYVAAIAIAMLSALAWSTSFTLNERSMKRLEERITTYQAESNEVDFNDFRSLNQQLSLLKSANKIFPFANQVPIIMQLGLYQGNTFHNPLKKAYHKQLNLLLGPAIKLRLEQQIRLNMTQPDYLFQALKTYLMLSLPDKLENYFVQSWMQHDWETHLVGESTVQKQLQEHLSNYLQFSITPITVDDSLVQSARAVLRKVPIHHQIYNRIKSESKKQSDEYFSFSNKGGAEMNVVFSGTAQEIPYLYTNDGFTNVFIKNSFQYVQEFAKENWVLDTKNSDFSTADITLFNGKVKALYLEDYSRYWYMAIDNLQVNKFSNVSQAINMLTLITGPYSPFRNVLQLVSENTQLSLLTKVVESKKENKQINDKLISSVNGKSGQVLRFVNRSVNNKLVNLPDKPTDIVERKYFELNQSIVQKNNRPSHLNEVLSGLSELQGYLNNIESNMDDGETAYLFSKKRLTQANADAVGKLNLLARKSPEPLKTWLQDIATNSWQLVLSQSNKYLNSVYQNNVLPFYDSSMKNRYPLHSNASNESSLDDFTEFFKPDGIEETFFNNYLKDFVNIRKRPWSLKKVEGHSIAISTKVLRQFERAANIRRVFFKDKSGFPDISYSLKPLYLDSNISRFELIQGKQKIIYRHGPLISSKLKWPGDTNFSTAKISFEDLNGDRVIYKEEGPWAFFRIMDNYELKRTKLNNRYIIDYILEGKKAQFELIADSSRNPFNYNLLKRYRAPQRLN